MGNPILDFIEERKQRIEANSNNTKFEGSGKSF
jgi:hypothetical protein